jgi:hypothetical protein
MHSVDHILTQLLPVAEGDEGGSEPEDDGWQQGSQVTPCSCPHLPAPAHTYPHLTIILW